MPEEFCAGNSFVFLYFLVRHSYFSLFPFNYRKARRKRKGRNRKTKRKRWKDERSKYVEYVTRTYVCSTYVRYEGSKRRKKQRTNQPTKQGTNQASSKQPTKLYLAGRDARACSRSLYGHPRSLNSAMRFQKRFSQIYAVLRFHRYFLSPARRSFCLRYDDTPGGGGKRQPMRFNAVFLTRIHVYIVRYAYARTYYLYYIEKK